MEREIGDAGPGGSGHGFSASPLEAAGAAAGSATATAGTARTGDGDAFSIPVFGEGGTDGDNSFRVMVTARTVTFFISFTERTQQLKL